MFNLGFLIAAQFVYRLILLDCKPCRLNERRYEIDVVKLPPA